MSGRYSPDGYRGQPPTYGEEPAYGGWPGYEGGGEHAYRDGQPDHDPPGYPDYPGHAPNPYWGPAYPGPREYPPSTGHEGYRDYPAYHDDYPAYHDRRDYRELRGRQAIETRTPPRGRRRAGRSGPAALVAAPAKRRGRGLTIALSVVTVIALSAVGGWLVARPFMSQWPATLSKPERLAGLELSNEPALQQAANEIAADIRKHVKAGGAVAAFYHDPAADEKMVALVGGTALVVNPKAELDGVFRDVRSGGMSIGEVQNMNAGPLGGLVRCGSVEHQANGDNNKVPMSVCAWADHGSFVIGLFFHRSLEESAELLRTIRGEMLKR